MKTEIEYAKQWAVNGLSLEKTREYCKLFDSPNDWSPFTDEQFLHIFRKEVIQPWWERFITTSAGISKCHTMFEGNKNPEEFRFDTYLEYNDREFWMGDEAYFKSKEVLNQTSEKTTPSDYACALTDIKPPRYNCADNVCDCTEECLKQAAKTPEKMEDKDTRKAAERKLLEANVWGKKVLYMKDNEMMKVDFDRVVSKMIEFAQSQSAEATTEDKSLNETIIAYKQHGNNLMAIKAVKDKKNLPLQESRDYVDKVWMNHISKPTKESGLMDKLQGLIEAYSACMWNIENCGNMDASPVLRREHHTYEGVIRDIKEILKS